MEFLPSKGKIRQFLNSPLGNIISKNVSKRIEFRSLTTEGFVIKFIRFVVSEDSSNFVSPEGCLIFSKFSFIFRTVSLLFSFLTLAILRECFKCSH